jgi:hypothetical protein
MTGAIFGEISKAVEGYFACCLAHAILLALLMMWLSLSALAQLKKSEMPCGCDMSFCMAYLVELQG